MTLTLGFVVAEISMTAFLTEVIRMIIRGLATFRLYVGRGILWIIAPAQNEALRPTIENIENIRRLFSGKP